MKNTEEKRMEQELEEHVAFVQKGIELGLFRELTPRELFVKSVIKVRQANRGAKQTLLAEAYTISGNDRRPRVFAALFAMDVVEHALCALLKELEECQYTSEKSMPSGDAHTTYRDDDTIWGDLIWAKR